MKRYQVTIYFSEIYEVNADDEQEAQDIANRYLKNLSNIPIPDEYEVECLDEE